MKRQKKTFWRKALEAALLVFLLPVILPLALIALAFGLAHRVTLFMLIWVLWLRRGKDILAVYSDSPIWHEYMITQVLPLIEERAVVLNWSERNKWSKWSFQVHVFHYFGGDREFNPMVVVLRPFRRARTFRFWLPFKEWKKGDREPVESLRRELSSTLKR